MNELNGLMLFVCCMLAGIVYRVSDIQEKLREIRDVLHKEEEAERGK